MKRTAITILLIAKNGYWSKFSYHRRTCKYLLGWIKYFQVNIKIESLNWKQVLEISMISIIAS